MVHYGTCIYCNQIIAFDCDNELSETEKNIMAARTCECDKAREKRAGILTLSRAEAQITEIAEEYDYSISEILKMGAKLIQDGMIDKINIVTASGDKISVAIASKGIKVSKIKTKKVERTV